MLWLQLLQYEDLLLVAVLDHCKLNIFVFLVSWLDETKHLKTSVWTLGNCDEEFSLFSTTFSFLEKKQSQQINDLFLRPSAAPRRRRHSASSEQI